MRHRILAPAALLAALVPALALAGCGSSDGGSSAEAPATSTTGTTGGPSTTPTTATATDGAAEVGIGPDASAPMRGQRYCEVLALHLADGSATADVWNSWPLGPCPQARWAALDPKELAKQQDVPLVVLNGPRYWLMDRIAKVGDVGSLPKDDFGGIPMYRQASVGIGPVADAATPYVAHEVDRKTTFTFDAGRRVFELVDDRGDTWVMQSWSQEEDPKLAEADLPGLGDRLELPDGWSYRSLVLDRPLEVVTTTQAARVLKDDLGNSYSALPPTD